MPCYSPLTGYYARKKNPDTGKRSIVFKPTEARFKLLMDGRRVVDRVVLPCGRCIGCRLEYSRQWAMRACHEASLYEDNCFILLSYNDDNLPANGSINPDHVVKFMKDLRAHEDYRLEKLGLSKEEREACAIRSFGCAEYGENYARPHYHLILFNYDFPDKVFHKKTPAGFDLHRSPLLEELWPYGYSNIGSVTFESAAYVARYVTKKISGPRKEEHYGGRLPERPVAVSRRPGLGYAYFKKYWRDFYPSDSVIFRGKKMRPPKYYDRLFEIEFPTEFATLKKRRKKKALSLAEHPDNSFRRLLDRETVQNLRFKKLIRGYENAET